MGGVQQRRGPTAKYRYVVIIGVSELEIATWPFAKMAANKTFSNAGVGYQIIGSRAAVAGAGTLFSRV